MIVTGSAINKQWLFLGSSRSMVRLWFRYGACTSLPIYLGGHCTGQQDHLWVQVPLCVIFGWASSWSMHSVVLLCLEYAPARLYSSAQYLSTLGVCISSVVLLCTILEYAWSMHQQRCTPPLQWATFVGGHSTAESSTTGVTISWAFFAHNQVYPSDITNGNSKKCLTFVHAMIDYWRYPHLSRQRV